MFKLIIDKYVQEHNEFLVSDGTGKLILPKEFHLIILDNMTSVTHEEQHQVKATNPSPKEYLIFTEGFCESCSFYQAPHVWLRR